MPRFIDFPKACGLSTYQRAIDKVVEWIDVRGFAKSIYQVGGIQHPGISDIDLFVIAKAGMHCDENPLEVLNEKERYPFTHSCFLVCEKELEHFSKYSILHGFRRIIGDDLGLDSVSAIKPTESIKRQIAIEFVIKNYVDLSIQLAYRIIKTRVFLQHVKGLRYDLELLKIDSGKLNDVINQGVAFTDDWFQQRPTDLQLWDFAQQVSEALWEMTLVCAETPVFSPVLPKIKLAKNIVLKNNSEIKFGRLGVLVPTFGLVSERRHFNLNHRFNYFSMNLPMQVAKQGSEIADRFRFQTKSKSFVREQFPRFSAPVPPLFYNAL